MLAFAQKDAPPMPPFVHVPPPGSQWQVDLTSGGKPGSGAPAVPIRLAMEVGRNKVELGIVSYSDGSEARFYVASGYLLQTAANGSGVSAWKPTANPGPDLRTPSFPRVEWIAAADYAGIEALDKQPCHKFQGRGMTAWIDVETRYPVRVEADGLIYRFSKVSALPDNVVLPSEYAAALKKVDGEQAALEFMKRLNSPPAN